MIKMVMIVAASENGVIGVGGELPWRLSADLKRFKTLTMGHHIVMGRKTFESIGRLLPGRTSVIVTRQTGYQTSGAVVVNSVDDVLAVTRSDPSPFVVGGAEIYQLLLPHVTEIQLTRVHATLAGDTFLPAIDWPQWELVESQRQDRDERNNFDFSCEIYQRRPADS